MDGQDEGMRMTLADGDLHFDLFLLLLGGQIGDLVFALALGAPSAVPP
jgi:hypothetical protein